MKSNGYDFYLWNNGQTTSGNFMIPFDITLKAGQPYVFFLNKRNKETDNSPDFVLTLKESVSK